MSWCVALWSVGHYGQLLPRTNRAEAFIRSGRRISGATCDASQYGDGAGLCPHKGRSERTPGVRVALISRPRPAAVVNFRKLVIPTIDGRGCGRHFQADRRANDGSLGGRAYRRGLPTCAGRPQGFSFLSCLSANHVAEIIAWQCEIPHRHPFLPLDGQRTSSTALLHRASRCPASGTWRRMGSTLEGS